MKCEKIRNTNWFHSLNISFGYLCEKTQWKILLQRINSANIKYSNFSNWIIVINLTTFSIICYSIDIRLWLSLRIKGLTLSTKLVLKNWFFNLSVEIYQNCFFHLKVIKRSFFVNFFSKNNQIITLPYLYINYSNLSLDFNLTKD